jgi:hypothetical protein
MSRSGAIRNPPFGCERMSALGQDRTYALQ